MFCQFAGILTKSPVKLHSEAGTTILSNKTGFESKVLKRNSTCARFTSAAHSIFVLIVAPAKLAGFGKTLT